MQDLTGTNASNNDSVSVIHLVWLPYGTGLFSRFIASYCDVSSGYPHELVLLFNGVNKKEDVQPYLSIVESHGISYRTLIHFGKCQDIEAYFWAAGQLNTKYLLFLNSYVEIREPGWLGLYMKRIGKEKAGIVGATGSWQSYYSSVFEKHSWKWDKQKSLSGNITKYKLLLKAAIWWPRYFSSFPNPHLRTNAFVINRGLFLSLWHKPLKNKFMAYVMESGRKSITNQVLLKGLDALVIDRFGNAYQKEQWADSNTFWKSKQENLLITDNQTRAYDNADSIAKVKMTYLAWGTNE